MLVWFVKNAFIHVCPNVHACTDMRAARLRLLVYMRLIMAYGCSGMHAALVSDPGCWRPGSCSWRRCDWPGRPPPGPLPGGVSCCPELPALPRHAGFLGGAAEPTPSPKSPRRRAWRGPLQRHEGGHRLQTENEQSTNYMNQSSDRN